MLEFKRRREIQARIFSFATIFLLILIVVFLSQHVYERFTIEREMAGRRAESETELNALRQRAAALEAKVEYLQDERGVEAEIRSRFDVAKEGEQVVIIVEDERELEAESAVQPADIPKPERRWYQWW